MKVIPAEYRNSICEIKNSQNETINTGYVTAITDEYLEITFKEEDHKVLIANTLMKVIVTNDALGSKVYIGRVYIGSTKKIRFTEIVSLMDFEKREFFRINIFQHADLYLDELTVEQSYIDLFEKHDIIINNISLNGLFFYSKRSFVINEKIYIALELTIGKTIFPCRIFRITNEDDRIGYGCKFEKLSTRVSDSLYRYIFEKQRELIQRTKL